MIKISPSLLSADFMNLEIDIKNVQKAGADLLHLDVMDGHFVPNLTFGVPIIKQIERISEIPLDVHLMVTNPGDYFDALADCGVKYISFHQETVFHAHRLIYSLKEKGIKAGIALNPATPVDTLIPVLPDLDFVLLMSVNPGFGGQSFLPLVLSKIRNLRKLSEETNPELEIEIDGGVNAENAVELRNAGADILVAGSFIFGSNNFKERIESLK